MRISPSLLFFTPLALGASAQAQQPALQADWIQSPINGNWVGLDYAARSWVDADSLARSLGGNLITVRNQAEQDWLDSTVGTYGLNCWHGFNDRAVEGTWVWSSGETVTPPFTNWAPGEPNNSLGNEDGAHFFYGKKGGLWNDRTVTYAQSSVLEFPSIPQVGWSWPRNQATGQRPVYGVLADFDGDGDLDYASPDALNNASPGMVSLHWNDGTGQFTAGPSYQVQVQPYACLALDHDQDGDLDIIVICTQGALLALDNAGTDFSAQITIDSGNFLHIASQDFDGDGIADLIATTRTPASSIRSYRGQPGGGFGPAQVVAGWAGTDPRGLACSDLDGDGDQDVVVSVDGSNRVDLLLNDGSGVFSLDTLNNMPGTRPFDPSIADIDGDGDQDILIPFLGDNLLSVWLNDGGAIFTKSQEYAAGVGPHYSCVADLDGDGDPDVAVPSHLSDDLRVYWNDGTGLFSSHEVFSGHDYALFSTAGDLNGDGSPDLLVSSYYADRFTTWMNHRSSDCNSNGIPDNQDIANGTSGDCDNNGVPDECDLADPSLDCNLNGILDECDLAAGSSADCNANGVPDECDIASGTSLDINQNGIPDECETNGPFWFLSPVNGHWYTSLAPQTWADAQAQAATYGGNLATIRDDPENAWLASTFTASGPATYPWIGYTDMKKEGTFVWASGETPGYTNWRPNQPDDYNGADWTVLVPGVGLWMDEPYLPTRVGIVEVISADCDGDWVPDAYQIAQDPTLDWNGDGVLDACTGPNYCAANANASGLPGAMSVSGSPTITDNNFTLTASQLPNNEWGYFLMAETQGFIPLIGGSSGNLCLGLPFYRFNNQSSGTGKVLNSGSTGSFSFMPDLTNLPQNVNFMVGETWNFQAWFRDWNGGNTSNFTDGIEVMFR